jgi:uncharacterized protein YigE (DUF2233 family)
MIRRILAMAAVVMVATGCHARTAQSQPDACRQQAFSSATFTDCVVDPARMRVSIMLDGSDKTPLRSLKRLAAQSGDASIAFAMNAGMFDDTGHPIGLLIINGRTVHPLNTRNGGGNFYMQPNGVFSIDDRGAHIRTTIAFVSAPTHGIRFATQSGPMLLIDGRTHPRIAADGASRNIRNGVGIDHAGHLHFVISDAPVSFGVLARFFRDGLGCADALYLDGYVSSLWDPAAGRIDDRAPLGPLIVVRNS